MRHLRPLFIFWAALTIALSVFVVLSVPAFFIALWFAIVLWVTPKWRTAGIWLEKEAR